MNFANKNSRYILVQVSIFFREKTYNLRQKQGRYSIDSPSILHRWSIVSMEYRWTTDGLTMEYVRSQNKLSNVGSYLLRVSSYNKFSLISLAIIENYYCPLKFYQKFGTCFSLVSQSEQMSFTPWFKIIYFNEIWKSVAFICTKNSIKACFYTYHLDNCKKMFIFAFKWIPFCFIAENYISIIKNHKKKISNEEC